MTALQGKTILITGATNGIGKASALALARMGAELILLCRNPDKGEATRAEIARAVPDSKVDLLSADLASLAQVRKAAEEFLATNRPLHVLLNNAGLVMTRRELTVDGYETTFAVNHLAPFLLTHLLLDRLRASAPGRVVTVSSHAHRMIRGRIPLDDLMSEQRYRAFTVYGKSKLANILFTRELARRLAGSGVTANCLHPGVVATALGTNNGPFARFLTRVASPFLISPEKGARTSVYLCSSPDIEGVSGAYFANCKEVVPRPGARNDEDARALWELSERLTGVASAPA